MTLASVAYHPYYFRVAFSQTVGDDSLGCIVVVTIGCCPLKLPQSGLKTAFLLRNFSQQHQGLVWGRLLLFRFFFSYQIMVILNTPHKVQIPDAPPDSITSIHLLHVCLWG